MNLATLNPSDYNVLFLVMDSCRYDTTQKAGIPFINSLGEIRPAITHGDYTLPAHMAMFEGRLPTVEEPPWLPLYTDSVRQLWRVSPEGFFQTRPKSEIALSLTGDNIIEGHRRLGYFTLGAAAMNYFTKGRTLYNMFDTFLDYYDISEDLISERPLNRFPLNYSGDMIAKLKAYERWFLFINTPETHYPYDVGVVGHEPSMLVLLEKMKRHLNLRHDIEEFTAGETRALHQLQIRALQAIDIRLKILVSRLPKNRPILIIITADHGESFGEKFCGFPRCGHLHPSPEVMQVPLLIGTI